MTDVARGNLADTPHRRHNPLTGEWVLVSPQRTERPWQGRVEAVAQRHAPVAYDPSCYLCPGNTRAGGARNPRYAEVHVFDNDFPALTPGSVVRNPESAIRNPESVIRNPESIVPVPLLRSAPEPGLCRVVCFSPRHDLTLAEMDVGAIRAVVDAWTREYEALGARDDIGWVQIFENKGELMGCSNPHPHGQIWAQRSLPVEPAKEAARVRAYHAEHGRTLLGDYLRVELERRERVVLENDGFVALVPYWAVWPFETMIVSREPRRSLLDLDDAGRDDLADVLRRVTVRYDNLFETSFPYSMGIHQAPVTGGPARAAGAHAEWHLHAHFYPPLLRSATVKKFMVGYEMLGEPQRDLTPEASAERLRAVGERHYRERERER